MDILDIIITRRSVRRFNRDAVSISDINKILEAARWAPSGLNNQPWRFKVVVDVQTKKSLAKFTKYGSIIKSASVIILVCMDVSDSYNRDKDLMASGACIQNMLLEAHSMGLGACWMGEILNKQSEVSRCLKFDSDLELMAVVAVGYQSGLPLTGTRKPIKKLMI